MAAPRTSKPPPAPPAHTRFGKYTLLDRLAVGGMAEVFRATEPRSAGERRVVVLKRMLPTISAEPGARAMFDAEAELGAQIHHPNVVTVLGTGEAEGQPFLALEYVRGVDLFRMMRFLTRGGRTLGIPLTLFVLEQMLAGLHAVHEARDGDGRRLDIVHRDVSPSNVLLSVHGDVKLGDLGIARARMSERFPQAPGNERAKGKLGYLSPEQVSGSELDARSDVFSAGIIAAELLMGRPLFAGGSELAVLLAIRDAKIQPFLEAMATLPPGLGDAVASALARDPIDRTESAADFSNALAPHLEGDRERLRLELATLVGAAITATDGEASDETTSPLTAAAGLSPEQVHAILSNADRESSTAELPSLDYRVRGADGKIRGPMPYAQVIEGMWDPLESTCRHASLSIL